MKVLTGILIALTIAAAPAFAEEAETADAKAPAVDAKPPMVEGGDSETDGSLAATMEDLEEFCKKQPLKFYGHFKLDMSRDSARAKDGNTAMRVLKQPYGDDDGAMVNVAPSLCTFT
jgi:hypothetical protein